MTDPIAGASASELEAMAQVLLRRADDLHAVGTTLNAKASNSVWHCDKATRYREAVRARQSESHQLAVKLRDLGRYLRLLGQQTADEQAAGVPTAAQATPGS